MKEEQYILFDTAKLLKDKGFDIPVKKHYYSSTGRESNVDTIYNNWNNDESFVSAPSQSLVMRWLREVHNIFIVINVGFNTYTSEPYYTAIVNKLNDDIAYPVNQINNGEYNNPEQAAESAIKYCLENLI